MNSTAEKIILDQIDRIRLGWAHASEAVQADDRMYLEEMATGPNRSEKIVSAAQTALQALKLT